MPKKTKHPITLQQWLNAIAATRTEKGLRDTYNAAELWFDGEHSSLAKLREETRLQKEYLKTHRGMKRNPEIHVDINSHNAEAAEYLKNPAPMQMNDIAVYRHAGMTAGRASKRRDAALVKFQKDWLTRALSMENEPYKSEARKAYNDAYAEEATPYLKNPRAKKRTFRTAKRPKWFSVAGYYRVYAATNAAKYFTMVAQFPRTPKGKSDSIQYAKALKRATPDAIIKVVDTKKAH